MDTSTWLSGFWKGSLPPGAFGSLILILALSILFLITPLALATVVVLSRIFDGPGTRPADLLRGAIAVLDSNLLEVTLLLTAAISTIAVQLLLRMDPKKPDKRSFRRIRNSLTEEIRKGTWVICDERDCSYPYDNLQGYLRARGLHHLIPLAPWSNRKRGSKGYVNILKIRIELKHPSQYKMIDRNEYYIRLMSSIWYMASGLSFTSFLVLATSSLVLGLSVWFGKGLTSEISPVVLLVPFGPALIGLFLSSQARKIIERFFHYQRVRELIYILETTYTVFKDQPELIQDICPDFKPRPLPALQEQ
jgi:hypothetical protein